MDRIKKQLREWDENFKDDFFFENLIGMVSICYLFLVCW